MGYALCAMDAGKETYSLETLRNYWRMTLPKFMSQESKQKQFSRQKEENLSHANVLRVPQSWQEKVLKSYHPTQFGKVSKREKISAKETRTNPILQENNVNKMIWKQGMISGVSLGVSFTVIMFKGDKTLYTPQESSFPIPLTYIDVVRRTNTPFGRVAGRSS